MSDSSDMNHTGSTFLQRWSQRKRQQSETVEFRGSQNASSSPESVPAMNDNIVSEQELPSIDSLDENSEVSMFFSEGVSDAIKRRALRKLFHMDKFNVCDGLDDYAEDYTVFQPLGNIVTAYQRLREENEKLKQAASDDGQAPVAATNDSEEERELAPEEERVENDSLPSDDLAVREIPDDEEHKEV